MKNTNYIMSNYQLIMSPNNDIKVAKILQQKYTFHYDTKTILNDFIYDGGIKHIIIKKNNNIICIIERIFEHSFSGSWDDDASYYIYFKTHNCDSDKINFNNSGIIDVRSYIKKNINYYKKENYYYYNNILENILCMTNDKKCDKIEYVDCKDHIILYEE